MNIIMRLKRLLIQFIFFTVMICLMACSGREKTGKDPVAEPPANEYKVIGYVAGWSGLDFSTIRAEKLTHINYAFANCVNGEVRFGTAEESIDDATLNVQDLVNLQKLKEINPDLKILISIGGWTWSKNFSDAALTGESREIFASSAVAFLKEHNLDGLDIDWEYPGQIGDMNVFRTEDKENFTLMLKRVREHLDMQSEKDGRKGANKYLLTIATGANQAYIDNTDLGEAHKYLDFINIMTYDYHSGLDSLTGHHANLFQSDMPGTTNHSSVMAVTRHIEAGVPAGKIVLGVPFYGRMWSGVSDDNNGLYQEAKSVGSTVSFRKIISDFTQDNGFTKYLDEAAGASYLFNSDMKIFVSYEDQTSLARKLDYLKENNLGGVMFWEYSEDYNGELLNTIHEGLKK